MIFLSKQFRPNKCSSLKVRVGAERNQISNVAGFAIRIELNVHIRVLLNAQARAFDRSIARLFANFADFASSQLSVR